MDVRRLGVLLFLLSCAAALLLIREEAAGRAAQPARTAQTTSAAPSPTPAYIAVESVRVEPVLQETQTAPVMLNVFDGESVTQQRLEDYLVHVVAGEMPALYEEQALRAQAVAARTYIAWKMPRYGGGGCSRAAGADVCTDSTHCMAYSSGEEMRQNWGENYEAYREKISQAVDETAGQILLYGGSPVQALFHASSGGRTEDAQAVWGTALPYLTSVESGEADTERTKRMTKAELAAALNRAFDGAGLTPENVQAQFLVRSRTPGGRADAVRVGRVMATGREVRSALNLSSTAFTVAYDGDQAILTTQGYGHGVGMSQEGANDMAQRGYVWQEILAHYYTGVTIGKMDA